MLPKEFVDQTGFAYVWIADDCHKMQLVEVDKSIQEMFPFLGQSGPVGSVAYFTHDENWLRLIRSWNTRSCFGLFA